MLFRQCVFISLVITGGVFLCVLLLGSFVLYLVRSLVLYLFMYLCIPFVVCFSLSMAPCTFL